IWNAAAAGATREEIFGTLEEFSKYDVPSNLLVDIEDYLSRYGKLLLEKSGEDLVLRCSDSNLADQLRLNKKISPFLLQEKRKNTFRIDPSNRGELKQRLVKIGFPVKDIAGYVDGDTFRFEMRETTLEGRPFGLRYYQEQSAAAFHQGGRAEGGSGVIVLPCGAGKTVVGITAMDLLQTKTLILATNVVALRQWRDEILDKTTVSEDDIAEYSGESKKFAPITIATYQIITYRKDKEGPFPHFGLFNAQNWGLIIYDEVHLLPAPVFRVTAEIQSRRRLGLTATLVREDGLEEDVFSLIGPKRYDVPWKELEQKGWIATAQCHELRIPLHPKVRLDYAASENRTKFRIASENPNKMKVIEDLLEKHQEDRVLIIGQYLEQVREISQKLKSPLITGQTPNARRVELFEAFRTGEIKFLVVSKVANFAIDLPDANVAIQVSGTFGSRQEEAQRLGRILRPKASGKRAEFYTVVTRDTVEQEFATKRQLFLTEQGYSYEISDCRDLFPDFVPPAYSS
ncbi:MAG: helicase-associated domain-containing protein, partial [Candidatus Omnitrophica bacterium]|nr:helicase-associated domain-containing protein [Candidatus Omnitrophota bacterium]